MSFGVEVLKASLANVRILFVGPKGNMTKLEQSALRMCKRDGDLRLRLEVLFNFLTLKDQLHPHPGTFIAPTLAELAARENCPPSVCSSTGPRCSLARRARSWTWFSSLPRMSPSLRTRASRPARLNSMLLGPPSAAGKKQARLNAMNRLTSGHSGTAT